MLHFTCHRLASGPAAGDVHDHTGSPSSLLYVTRKQQLAAYGYTAVRQWPRARRAGGWALWRCLKVCAAARSRWSLGAVAKGGSVQDGGGGASVLPDLQWRPLRARRKQQAAEA